MAQGLKQILILSNYLFMVAILAAKCCILDSLKIFVLKFYLNIQTVKDFILI